MFIKLRPDYIINSSAIQSIFIKNNSISFRLLKAECKFIDLQESIDDTYYRIDAKDEDDANAILKSMMEAYRNGDTIWISPTVDNFLSDPEVKDAGTTSE